jgi:acetoin utilization deacetylase AcuC-like enzyme
MQASTGLSMILRYRLVSAGFDAAEGDDLGECNVTPTGYAHMTAMLCSLAEGHILVALEVSSIYHWATANRLRSTGRLQS